MGLPHHSIATVRCGRLRGAPIEAEQSAETGIADDLAVDRRLTGSDRITAETQVIPLATVVREVLLDRMPQTSGTQVQSEERLDGA